MARVRTTRQAAAWVEQTGLALLFPKADVALPSLWEAVNGSALTNWAIRDEAGTFVAWTEEMGITWSAKQELPDQGLVCVGKHLARVVACIAPALLPALVTSDDRPEPAGVERAVAEAIEEGGPLTGPQLRALLGLEKREVEKAIVSLHRRLVLTNGGQVEQERGWSALGHDLLRRKWRLPAELPARDAARRELAACVLRNAGELTAADLRGVFGWRVKEAAAVLDEIASSRDEAGFRIWTQP